MTSRKNQMSSLTLYLVALAIFVSIDLVWLGVIAKEFYRGELGPLLAEKMSLPAAATFYVIYAAGLMLSGMSKSIEE